MLALKKASFLFYARFPFEAGFFYAAIAEMSSPALNCSKFPLSSYSGSTTISVANIKNVIKKYSPSARVNGLNKEKLLQLLEDIRKTNNITNADLCNKFADEIYLPKIVLKKADIPLSLRSQFIDLR